MTTRREFIRNFALAGIGLPMVTGLFPNPPTDSSFSCHWKDLKLKRFDFAGLSETPIQEGEQVKDLVEPTKFVVKKEKQSDGSTIFYRGEVFVVIGGRYCRVTGLDEVVTLNSNPDAPRKKG